MKENLILLPGLGADELVWEHQIKHLKDLVVPKVLVLDQHDSLASMVDEVLKQAPKRFCLAGHSMGGWVAGAVAAKAPERISKLFLVNTWARANPEMVAFQEISRQMIEAGKLEELLKKVFSNLLLMERLQEDTLLVSGIQQMFSRRDPQVFCRQMKAMCADYETYPLLQKISSPTLVIHGRKDAICSLEEHQAIKGAIQNSRLAVIEDTGHMMPMERPQATTALMRLWLES